MGMICAESQEILNEHSVQWQFVFTHSNIKVNRKTGTTTHPKHICFLTQKFKNLQLEKISHKHLFFSISIRVVLSLVHCEDFLQIKPWLADGITPILNIDFSSVNHCSSVHLSATAPTKTRYTSRYVIIIPPESHSDVISRGDCACIKCTIC